MSVLRAAGCGPRRDRRGLGVGGALRGSVQLREQTHPGGPDRSRPHGGARRDRRDGHGVRGADPDSDARADEHCHCHTDEQRLGRTDGHCHCRTDEQRLGQAAAVAARQA